MFSHHIPLPTAFLGHHRAAEWGACGQTLRGAGSMLTSPLEVLAHLQVSSHTPWQEEEQAQNLAHAFERLRMPL